jgi:hypothetical protein
MRVLGRKICCSQKCVRHPISSTIRHDTSLWRLNSFERHGLSSLLLVYLPWWHYFHYCETPLIDEKGGVWLRHVLYQI